MKFLLPTRILKTEGKIESPELLLKEKSLQIGYNESELTKFNGESYILLDFGKELSGGIRILTHSATKDTKVRIRFGESVGEASSEIGIDGSTNDHSTRDMIVDLQSWSDMTFGMTGFRFVRIDNITKDSNFTIKSIVASTIIDEREEVGTFTSDDEIINKIWNTAAYTLRLCLQNGYFWDGIKRDRLVWIGDLYPEMKAANYLYNDCKEIMNSLDFAFKETPLPRWISDMPSYSLWWLINLAEEYTVTGNKEIPLKYIDYINGLINQISTFVKEDGTTSYPFNFIDWKSQPKYNNEQVFYENLAGMAFITKIALTKISEVLKDLGKDTSIVENIILRLDKKQWDVKLFRQVASLGLIAGSKGMDETILNGGTNGISTFMSYIILSSICSLGKYDEAFSIMKEYYNGMLELGATTFFEDFDLNWTKNCNRIDELPSNNKKDFHGSNGDFCYKGYRHSLCHGWSAGVIAYIVENIAGVKFEGIGRKKLIINPHLSTLNKLKLNLPTPYGIIQISHEKEINGKIKTKVLTPDEIEIKIINR